MSSTVAGMTSKKGVNHERVKNRNAKLSPFRLMIGGDFVHLGASLVGDLEQIPFAVARGEERKGPLFVEEFDFRPRLMRLIVPFADRRDVEEFVGMTIRPGSSIATQTIRT